MPKHRFDEDNDYGVPPPKKRGRPPKPRDSNGNIIDSSPKGTVSKNGNEHFAVKSSGASSSAKSAEYSASKYSGPKSYKKKDMMSWSNSNSEDNQTEDDSDGSFRLGNQHKSSTSRRTSLKRSTSTPSTTAVPRRTSNRKAQTVDVNNPLVLLLPRTNPRTVLDINDAELPQFQHMLDTLDPEYGELGGDGHSSSSSFNLAALGVGAPDVAIPKVSEVVTAQEVLSRMKRGGTDALPAKKQRAGQKKAYSSTVSAMSEQERAQQEEYLFSLLAIRKSAAYFTEPTTNSRHYHKDYTGHHSALNYHVGIRASVRDVLGIDEVRLHGVHPADVSYCDYDADSDDELFVSTQLHSKAVTLTITEGSSSSSTEFSVSLRCFEAMITVLERDLEFAKSLRPLKSVVEKLLCSYHGQEFRVAKHSIKHVNRYLLEMDAAVKDPDFEVASAHRARSLNHLRKIVQQYESELNQDGLDLSQIQSLQMVRPSSLVHAGSSSSSQAVDGSDAVSRSSSIAAQGSPSRETSPFSGGDSHVSPPSRTTDSRTDEPELAAVNLVEPRQAEVSASPVMDGRVTASADMNFSDEVLEASEAMLVGDGAAGTDLSGVDTLDDLALLATSDDELLDAITDHNEQPTGASVPLTLSIETNLDRSSPSDVPLRERTASATSVTPSSNKNNKKKGRGGPRKKKNHMDDKLDVNEHPFYTPEQLSSMVSEERAVELLSEVYLYHERNSAAFVAVPTNLMEEFAKRVYRYWLNKRSKSQMSFLRCYHNFTRELKQQTNLAVPLAGAYSTPSLRTACEQIASIRYSLEMSRVVMDRVRRREKSKRQLIRLCGLAERKDGGEELPVDIAGLVNAAYLHGGDDSPVTEYSSSGSDNELIVLPPSILIDEPDTEPPLPSEPLFSTARRFFRREYDADHGRKDDGSQSQIQEDLEDVVEVSPPVVKNKGGRPRKHPRPDDNDSGHALTTSSSVAAEVAEVTQAPPAPSVVISPPKRRGRPPWKHLKDQQKEQQVEEQKKELEEHQEELQKEQQKELPKDRQKDQTQVHSAEERALRRPETASSSANELKKSTKKSGNIISVTKEELAEVFGASDSETDVRLSGYRKASGHPTSSTFRQPPVVPARLDVGRRGRTAEVGASSNQPVVPPQPAPVVIRKKPEAAAATAVHSSKKVKRMVVLSSEDELVSESSHGSEYKSKKAPKEKRLSNGMPGPPPSAPKPSEKGESSETKKGPRKNSLTPKKSDAVEESEELKAVESFAAPPPPSSAPASAVAAPATPAAAVAVSATEAALPSMPSPERDAPTAPSEKADVDGDSGEAPGAESSSSPGAAVSSPEMDVVAEPVLPVKLTWESLVANVSVPSLPVTKESMPPHTARADVVALLRRAEEEKAAKKPRLSTDENSMAVSTAALAPAVASTPVATQTSGARVNQVMIKSDQAHPMTTAPSAGVDAEFVNNVIARSSILSVPVVSVPVVPYLGRTSLGASSSSAVAAAPPLFYHPAYPMGLTHEQYLREMHLPYDPRRESGGSYGGDWDHGYRSSYKSSKSRRSSRRYDDYSDSEDDSGSDSRSDRSDRRERRRRRDEKYRHRSERSSDKHRRQSGGSDRRRSSNGNSASRRDRRYHDDEESNTIKLETDHEGRSEMHRRTTTPRNSTGGQLDVEASQTQQPLRLSSVVGFVGSSASSQPVESAFVPITRPSVVNEVPMVVDPPNNSSGRMERHERRDRTDRSDSRNRRYSRDRPPSGSGDRVKNKNKRGERDRDNRDRHASSSRFRHHSKSRKYEYSSEDESPDYSDNASDVQEAYHKNKSDDEVDSYQSNSEY